MSVKEIIKNENPTLIDVREPYELEVDGAVSGAINIPVSEIPLKLDEIKELKRPLVIFCRAGSRSETVVQFLEENGVKDLYNGGGFKDVLDIINN